MFYSIVATDNENSLEARKQTRSAHLARLESLVEQGKLLVAGPNPAVASAEPSAVGFSGSIIIAEFESLEGAQSWADQDPYLEAGVYRQVEVKPFKPVLP